jgi:hypothetical protein
MCWTLVPGTNGRCKDHSKVGAIVIFINKNNGLSYFAGFASAAVVVISIQAWLIHSQSTAQRL